MRRSSTLTSSTSSTGTCTSQLPSSPARTERSAGGRSSGQPYLLDDADLRRRPEHAEALAAGKRRHGTPVSLFQPMSPMVPGASAGVGYASMNLSEEGASGDHAAEAASSSRRASAAPRQPGAGDLERHAERLEAREDDHARRECGRDARAARRSSPPSRTGACRGCGAPRRTPRPRAPTRRACGASGRCRPWPAPRAEEGA